MNCGERDNRFWRIIPRPEDFIFDPLINALAKGFDRCNAFATG
jgi:hypothetical protein